MCSEETKEKKDKETCCNPEQFQSMFEMMNKCFEGEGGFDCSTIMKAMKNQFCCGLEAEKVTHGSDEETKSSCC